MAGPAGQEARSLLGISLYTASEAQRRRGSGAGFSAMPYQDGRRQWFDPLWHPQVPRLGREVELGFRDLLELKLVDTFGRAGVGLLTIRRAPAIARELVGDERPFSTARFRTDGRTVFLQALNETGEQVLLDLVKGQYAFNRFVEPSFRDLDLKDGVPARWWPLSRARSVVVDPERNFAHPIVAGHGVPTRALTDAVAAEGSVARVAALYDLPPRAVRDAVEFERRLAA